jgi:molecular chaperone DnaK (HSP70)
MTKVIKEVMTDKLYLNIGIDIGGCMQPILFKGQELPYEYELKLAPMNEQKEIEVGFYEGHRALVKDNQLLGKLFLTHEKEIGPFTLDIKVYLNLETNTNQMNVSIEGTLIETFQCSNESTAFFILKESEPYSELDEKIIEREKERQIFKEYIYQTLYTLNQIENSEKYNKTIILKLLNDAEDVAYMEDVTLEELQMAQKETEHNVNTFMNMVHRFL